MAELKFVTPIWPGFNFFVDDALQIPTNDWWNRPHVLSFEDKQKFDRNNQGSDSNTCETDGTCWLKAARSKGNFSLLGINCSQLAIESCFLQRMGNLTGLSVGCVSSSPELKSDISQINTALYYGQYSRYGSKTQAKEHVGAFDLLNSAPEFLNVSVLFNDTTKIILSGSQNPTPPLIRLSEPLSAIVDAFLNFNTSATSRLYGSLLGLREVLSTII
jgi:hypothetical protein